jgi:outer membrane protein TolC
MAGLTPNYLPKQMKPQQSFMPTTANRSAPVGRARHARTALPVLAAMVMAIVSVVVLTLAGCASSAGIAPTAQSVAPADIGLDSGAAPMAGPAPAADWWRAFGDAELNGLIERALAGNPSLKVAQARLARAEAAASGAQAAGGPQVDGSLDITRERFSATSIYPPPLGGSARWALHKSAPPGRSISSAATALRSGWPPRRWASWRSCYRRGWART